jgi:hypothetical protein
MQIWGNKKNWLESDLESEYSLSLLNKFHVILFRLINEQKKVQLIVNELEQSDWYF